VSAESDRQELLWRAEQLQNAGADVDEPQRRYIQNSPRVTEETAAKVVTGDKNSRDALRRLRELVEFLFRRTDELTIQELEFRNELMADYRLASLLRIFQPDVWHALFCVYLRDFVFPRWNLSSVKKARARKRGKAGKRDGEKKFKKNLASVTGRKPLVQGKRSKGQRKKTPDHGKENSDQGKF
jgi:hypothetical protein